MRVSICLILRIIFIIIFFITPFLALTYTNSYASTGLFTYFDKTTGADIIDYGRIFRIKPPRQNKVVDFLPWFQKHSDKIIFEFEDFIKKYPDSDLVPEAKLRIAERYQISWRKEMALPWLNDVINNHPSDKHYSMIKHGWSGEYTAAWALYYRYAWFSRADTTDLETIFNEYPDSKEVVENVKRILKGN